MPAAPPPDISHDLSGRKALVTGATSGLGWRYAHVLAKCGASVAIAGRRVDRLKQLEAELGSYGAEVSSVVLDVSDTRSILAGLDQAERDLGTIDTLINNAGVPDADYVTRLPLEKINQVFDVNLRGPFILAAEVGKRLIKAKKPGRIVNISSAASYHYDGDGAALYSTTKAGLNRMTEALAVEWASFHINVNAIAPGAFHSEMLDDMLERVDGFEENLPRKRVFQAAQLDSSLLYLLAPASDAVTGTILRVDDGQYPR